MEDKLVIVGIIKLVNIDWNYISTCLGGVSRGGESWCVE